MTQIDSLRIYFVLPADDSMESECSAEMKFASKLVLQYGGNAKFIKPSSCYDISPLKKDIFIFDKFEGKAFETLKQNLTKIIGVPCLTACLINGRTIPPSPYPIYMEAMRNIWVTTTGFDQKTKKQIQEKIQYMGGYFDNSLRSVITHLIAYNNISSKAIHAFKNNIKIMKLSWIDDVWQQNLIKNVNGDDEIFSHHKSPLFHNLYITSSGISKRDKCILKEIIEKNGGTFTGNLEGNVTNILLVTKPEGEKFRVAKNWKIICVTPVWIQDCVNAKAILSFKPYEIDFNKPKASTPNKENNTVNFSADFTSNISMITNGLEINKANIDESATINTNIGNICQQLKNVSNCENIIKSSHSNVIDNILLKWCKDAGQFLDGLNIFLYGFQSDECEKLKKILNLGGATRFNEMSESVTHVIVGRNEDKNLSKLAKSGAYILSIDWLVESMKIKGRANENKFLIIRDSSNSSEPPSPMSKQGARLLSQNENIKKPNFNSTFHQESHLDELLCKYNSSKAGEPFDHQVTAGRNFSNTNYEISRPETSNSNNSDLTSDEFFENLTFFLSSDFSEDEIKYLEDLIVERKGQIVGGRYFGVPDYAVVPAIGALLTEVTAKEVVNIYFIKDCCAESSLLTPRYYHQPVAFVKNSTPLKNCVVSVSNYYQGEREFMEMLIEALGGIAQSLLAKKSKQGALKSTHLVCVEPHGQKYEGALRWGVPVVHHEWLFRCAALGVRVSEREYLIGNSKISDDETLQENNAQLYSKTNNCIELNPTRTNSLLKNISGGILNEKIVTNSCSPVAPCENLPQPLQTPVLHNAIKKVKDTETPKNGSPDPNRTITPTSPYGAFYGKGNPTPSTRKRIWKWMNQGVEFPVDPPSKLVEKEINTTPISQLISRHFEMLKRKPEELPPDSPTHLPLKKLNLDVNDAGSSNKEFVDSGFKIMKQIEENFTKNDIKSPCSLKKTDYEDRQMVVVTESQAHTEVGWEDPDEKEVVLKSIEKAAKIEFKPKVFMFSCLSEQSEIRLLIEECGGVISGLPYFDKKATHLITGNLTRAEKLMGSIASGLWVLHPSYLDALKKTKNVYEVPEEDYEWGSPKQKSRLNLLSSNAKEYAQCSHDWRVSISQGHPPAFTNSKILLHISESKYDSFKRLIEAGNGSVVKGLAPNYHNVEADLCVYEANNTEDINFASLARKNIRCVALVYISDVLLKKEDAIEKNLIPEFFKLWQQMSPKIL